MITFDCPQCGETLNYEDRYAGASAMCRKCGHAMTIPSPQRQQGQPDGLSTAIAELDPEFVANAAMIPRDYTAAAALMSTRGPQAVHARLGAGFWLTAFIFPPLAVLYGLRLHYDHPQKALAVLAPLIWSIVPILLLLGGLSLLSDRIAEKRQRLEAAQAAQQEPAQAMPRNDAQLRDECVAHLKEIGLALVRYADQDPQRTFPPLSPAAGRLMFTHEVYPAFISDLRLMVAPGDGDAGPLTASGAVEDPRLMVDDHSFLYLGYIVLNDAEVDTFAQLYRQTLGGGNRMQGDLPAPAGSGGTGTLYALRYDAVDSINLARQEQSIAAAAIPVLIERPEHYATPGGHVLYLDGRVAFLPYPGPWPMTEKTINTLLALDAM